MNPTEFAHIHDFEASSHQRPLVVDFTGSYCPPCRQLEPVLRDVAARYRDRLDVVTVDIEARPDLAQRYGVRSVPTLIAFRGGGVVGQQVGFSNRRRVEDFFAEVAG